MQYILTQEELDQLKADATQAVKKVQADLQAIWSTARDITPPNP